jgi:regulatory protein
MSDPERAYASAIRILSYRFNSEAELRRKLQAKKFEPDDIDEALARLRRESWLDDERFAVAFVRARSAKRIGPLRIRRELGAAGVDGDVIDRALAANHDEETAEATLTDLCAKRMRIVARRYGEEYLSTEEGRQRVAAYLVRQGYELGDVLGAIKRSMKSEG